MVNVFARFITVVLAFGTRPERASVELVVTVPKDAPANARVYIAGNTAELGAWRADGLAMARGEDGKYRAAFKAAKGATIEFKFTLGGWETVEKDANGSEIANRRLTAEKDTRLELAVQRWASSTERVIELAPINSVRYHKSFPSKFLKNDRTLAIYLPPNYFGTTDRRYPVLYMHDGQNLFDAATSFAGVEWQADETAERLIKVGKIAPILIVGIYNTPDRMNEYAPTRDTKLSAGGRGADYARFVIEEVKPFIDKTYRTRPQREHTAVAGSSMGGLISLYMATKHSDTFSMAGVMSPALMWGGRRAIADLEDDPAVLKRLRLWIDMGTEEAHDIEAFKRAIDETRRLSDLCKGAGLAPDRDYIYREVEGGKHNETAWAERFDQVLLFFFGQAGQP